MFKKAIFLVKKNPFLLPFLSFGIISRFIAIKVFGFLGYSPFPEMVTILITKRCNFHCIGCSSSSPDYTKNFNSQKNRELKTNDIKKLIDEVSFFKPFIYFNGGEPTIHPNLIELIKYVKSKGMVCALTTNGSLLNKDYAKELIESKLDFISVSIDGPEEFHDKVRGFKGAFKKATEGIRNIVSTRENLGVDYPHVRLASIIYPERVENSKFIVSLANDLKVNELGFGLLMYYPKRIIKDQKQFIQKFKTGGPDPIGYEIDDNEKINFSLNEYKDFINKTQQNAKMPVYFAYQGQDITDFFNPKIFPAKESSCFASWKGLLIQPNGDMGICQGFKFGSIFDGSILKQWNNEKIRDFRKLRAKMPFPACFRCNEGQEIKF